MATKRRSWTIKELKEFESGLYTVKELAALFDRSEANIRGTIQYYKLQNVKLEIKRWSEEDLRFIQENCNKMSNKQLAKHFGVKLGALEGAKRLNGISNETKKTMSGKDLDFIENNLHLSDVKLGEILGYSGQSIWWYRKKHHIKRK